MTPGPSATTDQYVGIDVSKAHLDLATRPGGAGERLSHDLESIDRLANRLRATAPA